MYKDCRFQWPCSFKAWACGRLLAGILGSNPAGDIHIYMYMYRDREPADNLATFMCEENSGIKAEVRVLTIKI